MIQFRQRNRQLLLLCAHTDRRQHLGVRNKHGRHQLFHIIAPAIVQHNANIGVNHILIPTRNFGTKPLESAHGFAAFLFRNAIVFRPEEFYKRWNNPCAQLLHVFIPRFRVKTHRFHRVSTYARQADFYAFPHKLFTQSKKRVRGLVPPSRGHVAHVAFTAG